MGAVDPRRHFVVSSSGLLQLILQVTTLPRQRQIFSAAVADLFINFFSANVPSSNSHMYGGILDNRCQEEAINHNMTFLLSFDFIFTVVAKLYQRETEMMFTDDNNPAQSRVGQKQEISRAESEGQCKV